MQHSPRKFWEVWGRSDALYNRWAAAHGVNNYRLFVLYVLDNHPGATQKAIADHAGLPKQTVNTVVRALRDEGYVTLSHASGDRREKNASLTPAGQTYARALLEPLYALEDTGFARMGDARVQEMMDKTHAKTCRILKQLGRAWPRPADEPALNAHSSTYRCLRVPRGI